MTSSWHLPKNICSLIPRLHDLSFLNSHAGNDEELMFAVLKANESMQERAEQNVSTSGWLENGSDALNILAITDEDYDDLIEDFVEQFSTL